jgi:RHS repeat-associated protein
MDPLLLTQRNSIYKSTINVLVVDDFPPKPIQIIHNNNVRIAISKPAKTNFTLQAIKQNPDKKAGAFARIAGMFKKLFAANEPPKDKKQAASSKIQKPDSGVSLLKRKEKDVPVQVASAGTPDYPAAPVKKVCKNGDPMYTYDPLDRVTSMTSPAGTTNYHYDTITGRLASITSPEGKTFAYGYNHGQLSTLDYPNGITAQYVFDDNGNLTMLDYKKGGSTVRSYGYAYDKNGMRTSMTDVDGTHNYTYDSLYQIVQATHPIAPNPLEQFSYDAVGNRLTDMTQNAYQYNELNQLLEDDSCKYLYDLDGNQSEKIDKATGDTTHFVYDIENKLVQVQKPGMVAQYAYDAVGRRMVKTVNGTITQFRYDGDNLIFEMDGNGSIIADYTFGTGTDNPLQMHRNAKNYYYVSDGLGSIAALTDSNASTVKEYKYSVYGLITNESGDSLVLNPFTYTSREYEKEFGIYFYRTRYYDPQISKFLSEDLIGYIGNDLNLYRYVANSVAILTDPFGLIDAGKIFNKQIELTAKDKIMETAPNCPDALIDKVATVIREEMTESEFDQLKKDKLDLLNPFKGKDRKEEAKEEIDNLAKKIAERAKKNNPDLAKQLEDCMKQHK